MLRKAILKNKIISTDLNRTFSDHTRGIIVKNKTKLLEKQILEVV